MSLENLFPDTEKLIRCNVINRYKELSVRLIELSNFRLWEHLMTNRHESTIKDVKLCLWVNKKTFEDNESVYAHADDVEQVNRIVVELYDDKYGFSNMITRFVTATETEQIISILRSHISKDHYTSEDCDIQVHEGFSIIKEHQVKNRPMIIGLDF
ncbi:MAG: hypothetical protein KZQ83_05955 [gamma proteobacterium symbiont of Taylorina sp.]|nr:hypothetical protein [gamma proteobacterium symbiont of Taylorina sp.]